MSANKTDLPSAFETQMRSMLADEYQEFYSSLQRPSPVSIRLNSHKNSGHGPLPVVPWCETGRYLDERPSFTMDPHFLAGGYYVQEASSMFVEQAVRQSVNYADSLRVLDLCAAPGGKSTHLLSLLSADSLLVSNDAIRSRATVLSENLQKWGHANMIVTNNDPSAFSNLHGFFDVILIDAPCSGEGLFRKDPDAIQEWSPDSVALCAARQRRIVQDVWPALKNEGLLIYCTCTYSEIENEGNLRWLESQQNLEFVPLQIPYPGIQEVSTDKMKAYRFFPHKVTGEGFFLSVMRKLGSALPVSSRLRKDESKKSAWTDRLQGDFVTIQNDQLSIAVPATLSRDVQWLSQQLNVLIRGTAVGSLKHDKLIPDHAAALSIHLDHSQFPVLDLNYDQAIQYLRKDQLHIGELKKGFTLVRFEGNAIGWVNVLENRINNLYPSGWRIRMH